MSRSRFAPVLATLVPFSLVVFMLAAGSAHAATLTLPGVTKFDPALGTLQSATVTIDPPPVMTSFYDAGFLEDVDPHLHNVSVNPVVLPPGLNPIVFPSATTSFETPDIGDDHNHFLNIPPVHKNHTGLMLQWFLTPGPSVPSVIVTAQVQVNESHTHLVPGMDTTPSTRFVYEPIPEPATAALVGLVLTAVASRRRRGA
ncbi:hypothetical protein Mal64_25610 [Pseudobythopirellula maris]|uniref:PEP-CTERM protein-sorting domain-containing protein n=1 Tax=Pseudobythopirellula maris TaxID=2527991 RepID=A0A5C5ZNP0_9BACT|nr:PEP-CTERM sorting domain-containing protein [Pseudobythopirellula maris]TWT89069.1 hypothetical protein Mal64_25610 [Pseudobythopirellula maris]